MNGSVSRVLHLSAPSPAARPGWGSLLCATAARGYLVLLLTLGAAALVPGIFGWHGTVVQTGSMLPHVRPGDVVVVADLPAGSPVPVGGVVQFWSAVPHGERGGLPILHRITADNGDGTYTTAGDANPSPDSMPLVRGQIIGQARLLVPRIGLPSLWLNSRDYLPLVLWLAGTGLSLIVVGRVLLSDAPAADAAGADGADDAPARPVPEGSGAHAKPHRAVVGRRAVLGLIGVAAAGGLVAAPPTRSAAAFTGLTASAANTWKAAASWTPPPSLGRAAQFALLAATSLEDKQGSSLTGAVGTSPGTTITGFSSTTRHPNTVEAQNAMTDARLLGDDLAARPATTALGSTLSGTISPGVYTSSSALTVSGSLVLDGRGSTEALFIFRAPSISVAQGSAVTVINGAQAKNVFWRSEGSVTFNSVGATASTNSSSSLGTHVAVGTVQLSSGASVRGRLFSLQNSVSITKSTVALPAT